MRPRIGSGTPLRWHCNWLPPRRQGASRHWRRHCRRQWLEVLPPGPIAKHCWSRCCLPTLGWSFRFHPTSRRATNRCSTIRLSRAPSRSTPCRLGRARLRASLGKFYASWTELRHGHLGEDKCWRTAVPALAPLQIPSRQLAAGVLSGNPTRRDASAWEPLRMYKANGRKRN